ncbi:MAG: hypothetical protein QXN05_04320 [Acidilobaceae archaeon]
MKLTRRDFLKLSASTALLASLDWDHVVKAALSTIQKGKYNIIWFEAQSCTGDTGSLLLATDPNVIQVLAGHLHVVGPGAVALLYHDAVMPQWGEEALEILRKAIAGELDPFVLVVEGSIPIDEKAGGPEGSDYWCFIGEERGKPISCLEWIRRLLRRAVAVVAVGSCSSYGGIPANKLWDPGFFKDYGFDLFEKYPDGWSRSPTGAVGFFEDKIRGFKGLLDLLPEAEPFRKFAAGEKCELLKDCKPVVAVPGCPANGNATLKTLAHLVLALEGLMPLSRDQFDDIGRPKYFFGETTHNNCPRAGHYAAGRWRMYPGDGTEFCLWGIGCKGPISHCPWNRLGWVNGVGGCVRQGSVCMGCHEPGFTDAYEPFFQKMPYVFATRQALVGTLAGTVAVAAVVGLASGVLAYMKRRTQGATKHD